MERMKLTEKEKDQIVKRGAEAMSKIIERMSIEMGELEEENKRLKEINESQNEEIQRFKDNAMQDMREITELEIENKKLRDLKCAPSNLKTVIRIGKENERLEKENEKLKEIIKDHQLYEEKLEHRIIELEELLHGE